MLWGTLSSAPECPLNTTIGTHRRVVWVDADLAELKEIKNSLGGTVNDVFLAIVSGALARWMRTRGTDTKGLELRGAVPVSVRTEDQKDDAGNKITIMIGRLPTYLDDPVARLHKVSEQMKHLKESKQAVGAEAIARVEDFAPPNILARSSRLHFSSRLYNLLVTNVPGPQFPLFLLGRELDEMIPVAFLAPNQALAIAIFSYNGKVRIGLIGDYDEMTDLDDLAEYVDRLRRRAARAGATQAARSGAVEPRRRSGPAVRLRGRWTSWSSATTSTRRGWRKARSPRSRDGEALLKVGSFGLTANNITYCVFGDAMNYWDFFPAEDGWGHMPTWGFARGGGVEGRRSRRGRPASTATSPLPPTCTSSPDRIDERGFNDGAEHRKPLPSAYQGYRRTDADPIYDEKLEAEQIIFWPLFYTSFWSTTSSPTRTSSAPARCCSPAPPRRRR